jgi:hypothetical protein
MSIRCETPTREAPRTLGWRPPALFRRRRDTNKEWTVPKVQAGRIKMNYEQQGSGEPLILIPYLAADNACYAFQVPDYSK